MATKRMLIDSTHPEETRVAVIEGDRLADYDVEIASRRQLKGNIYLAKVTRVEPSLQAAFVEYGGNRHGFLAFNEIHPDYYQIPIADREALLAEQAEAERSARDRAPAEDGGAIRDQNDEQSEERHGDDEEENDQGRTEGDGENENKNGEGDEDGSVEIVGGVDEDLDVQRPRTSPRHYKIQEVIKRRQILLVQVVKEERGTKGAALTTYLSIAGRYCVLMPNTTRGGGISRKITSTTDRKRLKKILGELEIPEGMAVIVRTAGAERSKAEIRRDYEYLIRLWNNIRDLVLTSIAPTLVYEEGNLIKRSLRDLYDRDTDSILIEGETAYRIAKDFMKLFIPSHAKKVQLYEGGNIPLFHRYQVENELEAMHLPRVELKSGGSIVLNPTEALVAVDVNSGRSTRERHIEETALRTNLEACDEIARQLRLRDLAGLIVIDFIDMEHTRNQGQVERRLKEAMKSDRARVQLGRISTFGLLELSRQRLRPSLFESSFTMCTFCAGTGVRRTTESTALSIFRRIEQEGVNGTAGQITVTVPIPVAFYLLNNKRGSLLEMEKRYGMTIVITGDDALIPPDFEIHSLGERAPYVPEMKALITRGAPGAVPEPEEEAEAEADVAAQPAQVADEAVTLAAEAEEQEETAKRTRRRRPRRRKRAEPGSETAAELDLGPDSGGARVESAVEGAAEAGSEAAAAELREDDEEDEDEEGDELQAGDDGQQDDEQAQLAKKRRRRGKRGGRRRARRPEQSDAEAGANADAGPEFAGPEFAGPEFAGPESAEPESAEPESAEPEFAEPEFAEPEFSGLPEAGTEPFFAEPTDLADVTGEPLASEPLGGDGFGSAFGGDEEGGRDDSGGGIVEPLGTDSAGAASPEASAEAAPDAESAPGAGSEREQESLRGDETGTGEELTAPEPTGPFAPAAEVDAHEWTAPGPEETENQGTESRQPEDQQPEWQQRGPGGADESPEAIEAPVHGAAPEPPAPEETAHEETAHGETAFARSQPVDAKPTFDEGGRERETADEHGGGDETASVGASRTVVINVGEDEDAESGGEGGRRGWWQRLLS